MSDFADALRGIDQRLHLPQPARARVILEIAGDLEDLYGHYVSSGMTEEDARKAALAGLDATDEVLRELSEVHASGMRRSMDRLVRQADSGWARALLWVVVAGAVVTAARVVLSPMFVDDAGVFLWPIGLSLVAGVAIGVLLLVRLQRFDADDPGPARRSLDRIATLIAAEGFFAGAGIWAELYWAVGRMAGDGGPLTPGFFAWVVRSSALLCAGLASALILALVWILVSHRTAVMEDARAGVLMAVSSVSRNNSETGGGR